MMDHFFITLPSVSEPGSTASNFRVILPHRIQLSGEWEVGLAEIIYPNTWYNITKRRNMNYVWFSLLPEDWNETSIDDKNIDSQLITVTVQIPQGRYIEAKDMVKKIQDKVEEKIILKLGGEQIYQDERLKDSVGFRIDEDDNRVVIRANKRIHSIKVHEDLAYMLGFKSGSIYKRDTLPSQQKGFAEIKGDFVPDTRNGFDTMYIYCDIVEQQIVGNKLAPLLRIIDVQGQFDNVINRVYDNPHYVKLLQKDIQVIEINLKNDVNEFVIFEFGKVCVKLHFRKALNYFD